MGGVKPAEGYFDIYGAFPEFTSKWFVLGSKKTVVAGANLVVKATVLFLLAQVVLFFRGNEKKGWFVPIKKNAR